MNAAVAIRRVSAFTLVELLVSMAILTLVMLLLVGITDATRRTWVFTTGKIEQFRDAREAFETLTRKLSQATLNTYWDYQKDSNGNPLTGSSNSYVRQSELRFISGDAKLKLLTSSTTVTTAVFFQAPLGYTSSANYADLENLLNTCGYFIEFGDDSRSRPAFLNGASPIVPLRYRFRLMEMVEPSESLTLYTYTSGSGNTTYSGKEWFSTPFNSSTNRPVRILAENIVALIILPKLTPEDEKSLQSSGAIPPVPLGTSLAPQYFYDSTVTNSNAALNTKNQLPPVIQVTVVAVDEASVKRLQSVLGTAMPDMGISNLFQDATKYQADLDQLQANLLKHPFTNAGATYSPAGNLPVPLNYRIFTTNISLKAAKWSRSQRN